MEPIMGRGGNIVDFHTCDFFPERWFDLVVVLQTNNTVLYDRLLQRGYKENKVRENVECEIMQVILENAHAAYAPNIVRAMSSESVGEMEQNVDALVAWVETYREQAASERGLRR
jgi:adenylate kinase